MPEEKFKLMVPLDASGVEEFTTKQVLKIVLRDRKGTMQSEKVKLDRERKGNATFGFAKMPGSLEVLIGPGDASDEEMLGIQTLSLKVSGRLWMTKRELTLKPIRITSYYWLWWLRWCRTFTIRGRVICPDGSPVPGAEVCAYDVDWWCFWSSKQQVGCTVTDIDGAFEIKFRWCCGWWPWWWWKSRFWRLDSTLLERVGEVLKPVPGLKFALIDNQPSLKLFEKFLSREEMRSLRGHNLNMLAAIRKRLLRELPLAPELERLRIWPWYSWLPWWDCTPDIIFKVTQDCESPGEVIYSDSVSETRWNIPTTLNNVVLHADENACCRPLPCPNPPCEEGECLILDTVCGIPLNQVGGNEGTPGPDGYANPGPVTLDDYDAHRPFAGIIPITKNPGDLLGYDYLEFQFFDEDLPVPDWAPLSMGTEVSFYRQYLETATGTWQWAPFPFTVISGHNVVETREHYETGSGLTWDSPGADAWWLSTNWNMLVPMDTTKFNDGTYRFRVLGWQESGGALVDTPDVIPVCGTGVPNEMILTFDNRVTNAVATHDASHNCGRGVHLCTTEPDTHIIAVRVNGVPVDICSTVAATEGTLEIDFMAQDADNHFAYYKLASTWGLSQSRSLLDRPGANVAVISGGPSGWYPGQYTGNYGTALDQGATAPNWGGGLFTLTIPMSEAFPEPCCYQLELWAFKRTIFGGRSGRRFTCNSGFYKRINGNETEYSIGVGGYPPKPPIPPVVTPIRTD